MDRKPLDENDVAGQQIRGMVQRHQTRRTVVGAQLALLSHKRLALSGNSIVVKGIPQRDRLLIVMDLIALGSINVNGLTFNDDDAAHYARQTQNNAFSAADTTAVALLRLDGGDASENRHVEVEISNLKDQEKLGFAVTIESGGAGAANAPDFVNNWVKWANTTDFIKQLRVTNTGSGVYAAGSQILVYG